MLIVCNECGKEISDAAASCPQCGLPRTSSAAQDHARANRTQHETTSATQAHAKNADLPEYPGYGKTSDEKKVSGLLGLGIALMPCIFAWFTLRKGHSTTARAVAFGWMVLFFILIGGSDPGSNSSTSRPAASSEAGDGSAEPEQQEIVSSISAGALIHAYYANEIAADQHYKGKRYEISGIVDSIAKDILGKMYITLGTGDRFEFQKVQAYFDKEMEAAVASVRPGEHLIVRCTVEGRMMNILAKNCEFVP